jgi:hypothetical protein
MWVEHLLTKKRAMNNEHSLENLHIESPCDASWSDMQGGERRRHCELCKLQVHNLSAMSRMAAEAILGAQRGEQQLCVRLEFHADGACVTAENPLPPAEEKPAKPMRVAAAILSAGLLAACVSDEPLKRPDGVEPAPAPEPAPSVEVNEQARQLLGRVLCTPEPPRRIMGSPGPPPKPEAE